MSRLKIALKFRVYVHKKCSKMSWKFEDSQSQNIYC